MSTLNRYIFLELLKLFLITLLVLTTMFIIQRLIFLTEWSMHRGVGMLGILKLLFYLFPGLFQTAVPLVSLFAILLSFSRLSEENELVVMMSSGKSLFSLSLPVLTFALIVSVLTAFLAFFLTPGSRIKFELTRLNLIQTKSEKALPIGQFVQFSKDSQIYIQRKDSSGLHNLILYQEGDQALLAESQESTRTIIFAQRARIQAPSQISQNWLLLENGIMVNYQAQSELDQFIEFEQAIARLDLGEIEKQKEKFASRLGATNFFQLIKRLYQSYLIINLANSAESEELHKKWEELREVRIEISQRLNQVLVCLFFPLWGIGLGIKPPRTSRTISYILAGIAGFGYYYFEILCQILALRKVLPIELTLYSPSLVVFLTGGWLFWQRARGKEPLSLIYQLDQYLKGLKARKK